MNRHIIKYFVVLFIVFATSCVQTKTIKKEVNYFRRPENVIESTKSNDFKYRTLTLKANIAISDGKQKMSFKAVIRMQKDSTIWSTMSILGIAGAKTFVTNDSLKMVNYKDKKYVAEKYEKLQEWLNTNLLTLSNLQNLLIGDWLEIAEFDKYRLKIDEGDYLVSTLSERRLENDWLDKKIDRFEKKIEKQELKDSEKALEKMERKQDKRPRKYEGLAVETIIDPIAFKVKRIKIKDYYFEGEMSTSYEDFKIVNDNNMPHLVKLIIESNRKLSIEIEYTKISVDEEISSPFSIPNKYERIRL